MFLLQIVYNSQEKKKKVLFDRFTHITHPFKASYYLVQILPESPLCSCWESAYTSSNIWIFFFFFLSNVCGFSAESMKKKILHLNLRSISLNWHNVCFSLSSYSIRLPKTTIVNHSLQQGTQSLLYALKMD